MPDNAVFFITHTWLRRLDCEILIRSGCLFAAAVENNKIVYVFQQPMRFEKLQNAAIQFIWITIWCKQGGFARFAARFFPTKPELFGCFDYSVMQPLGIITCEQQLYGRKESGNIFVFLIADVLTNPFMNGHLAAFELDDGHGDSVDINDQIGAAVAFALYCHLFGNLKIILHRVRPIDKVYHLFVLRYFRLHVYAITQQCIDLMVGVVQTYADIGRCLFEFRNGLVDLLIGITPSLQITTQQRLLYIRIVFAVFPITEIIVFQHILK